MHQLSWSRITRSGGLPAACSPRLDSTQLYPFNELALAWTSARLLNIFSASLLCPTSADGWTIRCSSLVNDKLVQAWLSRLIRMAVKTSQQLFHQWNVPSFDLHHSRLRLSRYFHQTIGAEKRLVKWLSQIHNDSRSNSHPPNVSYSSLQQEGEYTLEELNNLKPKACSLWSQRVVYFYIAVFQAGDAKAPGVQHFWRAMYAYPRAPVMWLWAPKSQKKVLRPYSVAARLLKSPQAPSFLIFSVCLAVTLRVVGGICRQLWRGCGYRGFCWPFVRWLF